MEIPFSKVEFKNLKYNENTVKVGDDTYIDFYHRQVCYACHSNAPGYSSFRSEGPWEFTCKKCRCRWTIDMSAKVIENRRTILKTLKEIDNKISEIKLIGAH